MSTFHPFSRLPAEIQQIIFGHSKPTTTTIYLREADLDITCISAPPSLLTTLRSARAVALSWALSSFPLWTTDDWQDVLFSPPDTTLQLVIAPSSSAAALAITWTELHAVLGDALPAAKTLHIMCSQPERLARLWMLPEAEVVAVGESCVEKGLFGSEVVASDRAVREMLDRELRVTCSKRYVGEGEGVEMECWGLVDERVEEGFGEGAGVFSTRAFVRVGEEVERPGQEVEGVEEGVEQVERSGKMLTIEALERLCEELAMLYPKDAKKGAKEDPGGSVMPEYD